MSAFDEVWIRIQRFAGEPFHQARGKEFAYSVREGFVKPTTSSLAISYNAFELAFGRRPIEAPGKLKDIEGASYLYAILTDPRISP
ncbi:MAG: hypothetical protein ACHQ50_04975 [Fimbriimonadales bacterium]